MAARHISNTGEVDKLPKSKSAEVQNKAAREPCQVTTARSPAWPAKGKADERRSRDTEVETEDWEPRGRKQQAKAGPNLATEAEKRHLTTCQKRVPIAATEEETPNSDPTARNPQACSQPWRSRRSSSRESHDSSDRYCGRVSEERWVRMGWDELTIPDLCARGRPRLLAKSTSMRAWSRPSARSGKGTGLATATAGPTTGSMSTMLTAATTARATGSAGATTGSTEPTRSVLAAASTAGVEGATAGSVASTSGTDGRKVAPAPTSSTALVRLLPEDEPKTRDPEAEADDNGAGLPGSTVGEAEDP